MISRILRTVSTRNDLSLLQIQNLFGNWNAYDSKSLWSHSTGGTNPTNFNDSVTRVSSADVSADNLAWNAAISYSPQSFQGTPFLFVPTSGFKHYSAPRVSWFDNITIFFVGVLSDSYNTFGSGYSTTHFSFGINGGYYSLIIGTNVSGSATTYRSNIAVDNKRHVFAAKIGCLANASIDGTFQMWIDGVEVVLTAINTVGTRFYNLNGRIHGLFTYKCEFCQAVVYKRSLTSQEISQANEYLINKWFSGYEYSSLPVNGSVLWLDGADVSTLFKDAGVTPVSAIGDQIYQWNDKSGNGYNASQATSGSRPTWNSQVIGTNGFGTVAFNGTSQFFNTGLQGQQAATVFAVVKKSATKTQSTTTNADLFDGIIDCDTAGQYGTGFGVNNTGGINTVYDNGFLSSASAFSNTSAETFCYQWDSSHLSFRRNGDLTSTIQYTQGSVTNSAYVIGKSNANALYFGGTIMEIICFPSYLSLPETQMIESYLKAKWGTP